MRELLVSEGQLVKGKLVREALPVLPSVSHPSKVSWVFSFLKSIQSPITSTSIT